MGGVVDGEVEGEVLAAGRALLEVDALHLVELLLDHLEVVGGAAPRGERARLHFEAAAHVERLQQRVAQPAGVEGERHVDGVGGDAAQQIGAAALARLDDAERLQLAHDLAHGRAADGERLHQLALGRKALAGAKVGAADVVGDARP